MAALPDAAPEPVVPAPWPEPAVLPLSELPLLAPLLPVVASGAAAILSRAILVAASQHLEPDACGIGSGVAGGLVCASAKVPAARRTAADNVVLIIGVPLGLEIGVSPMPRQCGRLSIVPIIRVLAEL